MVTQSPSEQVRAAGTGWVVLLSFLFRVLAILAVGVLIWWFSAPIAVLLQNTARFKYDKLEVSVQLTGDSREVLNALLAKIIETAALNDTQKIEKLESLLSRYERFIDATIISERTGGVVRTEYDKAFQQLLDRDVAGARSTLNELYARYPTQWNIHELRRTIADLPDKPNDGQFQQLYADIAKYCAWAADPKLIQDMDAAAGKVSALKRTGCGRPVVP